MKHSSPNSSHSLEEQRVLGCELAAAIKDANKGLSVVKHLIEERGADIHFEEDWPILRAIVWKRWDIARYLISKGADWRVSGTLTDKFETTEEVLKYLEMMAL